MENREETDSGAERQTGREVGERLQRESERGQCSPGVRGSRALHRGSSGKTPGGLARTGTL